MHSVEVASSGVGRQVLAVTSDQALVAEAVAAALTDRLVEAVVLPWPGTRAAGQRRGGRPAAGLLLSDLDTVATLQAARLAVADPATKWIVLTVAPPGPLWGAVAEAGAVAVVPSATGLAGVRVQLERLAAGDLAPQPGLSAHVASWRRYGAERAVGAGRVPLLSREEAEVLRRLADPEARAGGAAPRSTDEAAELLARAARRLGVRDLGEAVDAYRLARPAGDVAGDEAGDVVGDEAGDGADGG